jgi:internalin A
MGPIAFQVMSALKPQRKHFDGYFLDRDPDGFGTVMALKSSWSPKYARAVAKHDVKVIRLSMFNGWSDSDISFLRDLPALEGVDILSEKVTDVRVITELANLRLLSLTCKATGSIDLVKLKRLVRVFLTWRDAYRSLFALHTLKKITILGYPERDLWIWPQPNQVLFEMYLSSRKLESLRGIGNFPKIGKLTISKCPKLACLDDLSTSTSLENFVLAKCPGVENLTSVSSLHDLRELSIEDCGEIHSLAPLAECKRLEFLQVAGNTTLLDGDLSPLLSLPKLREVLVARRKHYSHTAEQLERGKA